MHTTGPRAIEREVEGRLGEALPAVDLREISFSGRRGTGTLRAVIDHPEGVTHELCVEVTRVLEAAGLRERWAIEVSSPGPEPPLRTLAHFRAAVGRRVRVRTDARRALGGTLVAADDAALRLAGAGGVREIPFSEVRRAWALETPDGAR